MTFSRHRQYVSLALAGLVVLSWMLLRSSSNSTMAQESGTDCTYSITFYPPPGCGEFCEPTSYTDLWADTLAFYLDIYTEAGWTHSDPVQDCTGGGGEITPEDITDVAQELVDSGNYDPWGRQTFCNVFVWDFAQLLFGKPLEELQGRAKDQIRQLRMHPDWSYLPSSRNNQALQQMLYAAQDAANDGQFVVVGWENPFPTAVNSGHVAVVLPGTPQYSSKWNMYVPNIAQAGDKGAIEGKLSDGFGAAKKNNIEIFIHE